MSSGADLVAKALKSGEWKERIDAKTQRRYYVHKATRRSVWNLAKELAARKETSRERPAGAATAAREERHQRIQQCVETEHELKKRLMQLEQEKVELEADVARLQAPVEAEEAQLSMLQRVVDDKRVAVSVVERERMDRRRARDAELRSIQQRVEALQGVAESERTFRLATEERHKNLLLETMELAAEVEKEKTAADSVAAAARGAARDLERAEVDAALEADEVARREELVEGARAELLVVAQQKAALEGRIAELEAAEATAVRQINAAEESLRRSAGAEDPAAGLMEQYQRKLHVHNMLERTTEREATAGRLEQANAQLRQIAAAAERNADALLRCVRAVDADTSRLRKAAAQCTDWCNESVH